MPLSLEPVVADPFNQIIDALASKIADTNLSLHKYLNSLGMPAITVFTQKGPGGAKNQWDIPADRCPGVVLLASAFPGVNDEGVGDERWYFQVAILFKVRLPNQDAQVGFQAAYEMIRTLFAGWRQPQLDPLGSIPGVCDYEVSGNITPHIADEAAGKSFAKMAFDVRFRFNQTILGGGV